MILFFKFFQKIEEKGTPPNSFYGTSNTLKTKPDNDTTRNENYRPTLLINIDEKILNKISVNQIQELIKNYTP